MCEAPMRRISKLDEAVGDATLRFQISFKGGVISTLYSEFCRGLSTGLVKGDTPSVDYGSDADSCEWQNSRCGSPRAPKSPM